MAHLGAGHVAPNPMVGAVLVYEGKIIGEGWHKKYGEAHAEVNCFDSVKEEDRHLIPESVMYVSLEPCAHYGKTPPCANRIVAEGVKKVIICNRDPFDKVDGRGISILEDAGIEVTVGVLEEEGRWLNRGFFTFHEENRPYIILKWAQTADGFIGPEDGSRIQISNKHSGQLVHKWRTEEAAILVGYKTALADNPELTARTWEGSNPLRIVIDRDLSLPQELKIFNTEAETWVLNSVKSDKFDTVSFIKVNDFSQLISSLLVELYKAGKMSLIVEGGAKLLQQFIDAGMWDEARVFMAPQYLGNGIPAPILSVSNKVLEEFISSDTLSAYLRNGTKYTLKEGAEL